MLEDICLRLPHPAALHQLGVPERIVFANVLCGHKAGQHGAQGWSLARGKGSHVDVDRQKDCHKPCAGKVDHKAVLQGLLRDRKGLVSGTKAHDKACHGKAKACKYSNDCDHLLPCVIEALGRQGGIKAEPFHSPWANHKPQALSGAPDKIAFALEAQNLAKKREYVAPGKQKDANGVDKAPYGPHHKVDDDEASLAKHPLPEILPP